MSSGATEIWLTALALACPVATACSRPRDKQQERAEPTASSENPDPARGRSREPPKVEPLDGGAIANAFDTASFAQPPPATGVEVPRLKLTRPKRTAGDLRHRLAGVLNALKLPASEKALGSWAGEVVATDEVSIAEPLPGVVVTYDPLLDDLEVVNINARGPTHLDAVDIPREAVDTMLRTLVAGGLLDRGFTFEDAHVSFVRSGVKGPGRHERWVDEILLEKNVAKAGIPVLDAGLRIGVTPAGTPASLRITGIEIEEVGLTRVSSPQGHQRQAFVDHLAPLVDRETVVAVTRRRPVYALPPGEMAAIVEPRYVVSYSTVNRGPHTLSSPRRLEFVSDLTDGGSDAETGPG